MDVKPQRSQSDQQTYGHMVLYTTRFLPPNLHCRNSKLKEAYKTRVSIPLSFSTNNSNRLNSATNPSQW